jgi:hypothetical protein
MRFETVDQPKEQIEKIIKTWLEVGDDGESLLLYFNGYEVLTITENGLYRLSHSIPEHMEIAHDNDYRILDITDRRE